MTDRYEVDALRRSLFRTRVLLAIMTIVALVEAMLLLPNQW
jgi:hypothetical protein